MMRGREKSDSAIVAGKPTNKAVPTAAEPVEPRAGAKGNASQQSTHRTQGRERVAAGSAEVAPRPEMATPVTFAKFWELHLNAMRRAPFDTSNDVADRDMRWYLDEHVDMLFGQNARDDLYPPVPCRPAE